MLNQILILLAVLSAMIFLFYFSAYMVYMFNKKNIKTDIDYYDEDEGEGEERKSN